MRNDKGNQGLIFGFEKKYAQKQNIDSDIIKLAEGKAHGGKEVDSIKKQDIDQYGDCLWMAYDKCFLQDKTAEDKFLHESYTKKAV